MPGDGAQGHGRGKKQGLLNMAETWEGLAADRLSDIQRQKRISALDRNIGP
jgi:hypothetical protein